MTKIEENNKRFEINLRNTNILTEHMTFGQMCFQQNVSKSKLICC